MKKIALLLGLGFILARPVSAEIWYLPIVNEGNACQFLDFDAVENGNALAVIFNSLAINMPTGDIGEGDRVVKNCLLVFPLREPPNFRLSRLRQLYEGGVIKTLGSYGRLAIRFQVARTPFGFRPVTSGSQTKVFPRSLDTESDPEFLINFDNKFPADRCGRQLYFRIFVQFEANRRNIDQAFIGGVDTLDADLTQRLRSMARPTWQRCR